MSQWHHESIAGLFSRWPADLNGDLWLDLYVSNMQSFAGNRNTRLESFPGTSEQQALYQRFAKGNDLLENQGDELAFTIAE